MSMRWTKDKLEADRQRLVKRLDQSHKQGLVYEHALMKIIAEPWWAVWRMRKHAVEAVYGGKETER